jgi:hypothetical protein
MQSLKIWKELQDGIRWRKTPKRSKSKIVEQEAPAKLTHWVVRHIHRNRILLDATELSRTPLTEIIYFTLGRPTSKTRWSCMQCSHRPDSLQRRTAALSLVKPKPFDKVDVRNHVTRFNLSIPCPGVMFHYRILTINYYGRCSFARHCIQAAKATKGSGFPPEYPWLSIRLSGCFRKICRNHV